MWGSVLVGPALVPVVVTIWGLEVWVQDFGCLSLREKVCLLKPFFP